MPRKKSNTKKVSYNGSTGTVSELAELFGFSYQKMWNLLGGFVHKKGKKRTPFSAKFFCSVCGSEFSANHPSAKFCSGKCREAANFHKPLGPGDCGMCGEKFFQKTGNQKFCSEKCQRKSGRPTPVPRPKKIPAVKIRVDHGMRGCAECGAKFHGKTRNHAYCSTECSSRACRRRALERSGTPRSRMTYEPGSCPRCLSMLPVPRNRSKKFCTDWCAAAFRLGSRPVTMTSDPCNCPICSAPLPVPRDDRIKYCSKECRSTQCDRNRRKLPSVRVREAMKRSLRIALSKHGLRKRCSILKYFGCTAKELKDHIEGQFVDGMSWDNYSSTGWHIDHIIPVSAFDVSMEAHKMVCFNRWNLRPLWAQDNIRKGDSMPPHDEIPRPIRKMAGKIGVL